jgi:hypothetical protein
LADLTETLKTFGPAGQLVGVLTTPSAPDADSGDLAIVIINAGIIHRTGPNRLHVRLARTIAAGGIPSFRFDLPGIGDSGTLGSTGSAFEESMTGIRAALDELSRMGVATRFALFGLCSGADLAFMTACVDPRVEGIILIDPNRIFGTWKSRLLRWGRTAARPVVWFRAMTGRYRLLRRLRDRMIGERAAAEPQDGVPVPSEAEARRRAAEALQGLMDRRVQLLYIVTQHYRGAYAYKRQFHDAFPEVEMDGKITVEMLFTAHHTFPSEASRALLQRTIGGWLRSAFPRGLEGAARS